MKKYIYSSLITSAFLFSPTSFAAEMKKDINVKQNVAAKQANKNDLNLALVPVKITTDKGHEFSAHMILNSIDLKKEIANHKITNIELTDKHKGKKIEADVWHLFL